MKHGEDGIRAVNFIGGVTKLGTDAAASVLTTEFLNLLPGFLFPRMRRRACMLSTRW